MLFVALGKVFRNPRYILLSLVVAVSISGSLLLASNSSLLWVMLTDESVSLLTTMTIAGQLLLGTPYSMGMFAVAMVVSNALLLGLLISMLWYVWRTKYTAGSWHKIFGLSGTATLAAVLGAGCAACGPLLVGSVLAMFGATGLLVLLPFHGAELGLVALLLLGYTLYTVATLITAPAICQ